MQQKVKTINSRNTEAEERRPKENYADPIAVGIAVV